MCKRIYILININNVILLSLILNFFLSRVSNIWNNEKNRDRLFLKKKKKKTSDKEMAFSGDEPWPAGVKPRGIEQKEHELLPL